MHESINKIQIYFTYFARNDSFVKVFEKVKSILRIDWSKINFHDMRGSLSSSSFENRSRIKSIKGIARIERRAVELIKTVIVDRLAVDILSFRRSSPVSLEKTPKWIAKHRATGIASIRANQFAKRSVDYFLVRFNRSPDLSHVFSNFFVEIFPHVIFAVLSSLHLFSNRCYSSTEYIREIRKMDLYC